ncbi:MAG: rhodanese-like domain-containing protein [Desulfotomaculaceae bacterium]
MKFKRALIIGITLILLIFLISGCNRAAEMDSANLKAAIEKTEAKPYAHPESLVSAEQLKRLLGQPNLTIIDTRSRDIYEQGHIPGAICFNIKSLSDPNRRGRFTSPKLLSLTIREYGINSTDHIVVYSDNYSHARLWFFLNMYGLNVQMLDGGIDQWLVNGYETAGGRERRPYLGKFKLSDEQLKERAIIETADVAAALEKPEENAIVDARSPEEYSGRGHIPGAVNIPWDQLIKEDQKFKTTEDLEKIFSEQEVTPDKRVIIYSDNATRASYVYFVLNKLLGYNNVKVYDGFYLYWAREKPLLKGTN